MLRLSRSNLLHDAVLNPARLYSYDFLISRWTDSICVISLSVGELTPFCSKAYQLGLAIGSLQAVFAPFLVCAEGFDKATLALRDKNRPAILAAEGKV
jgi:hypothetical protein